jgi:hypothetical protein
MSRHHRNSQISHIWHKMGSLVTARTLILFAILLFGIGVVGYGYINTEYIINKGPDDFKTQSYAAAYLREKYGEFSKGDRMSTRIVDFKSDHADGKQGKYTLECWYKGKHVTVQAYYDAGNFSSWSDSPSSSR